MFIYQDLLTAIGNEMRVYISRFANVLSLIIHNYISHPFKVVGRLRETQVTSG